MEYLTGRIQETVFGSVSWDYSAHFLNIGGYVSLKMALLWGLLGILFVMLFYRPLQAFLTGLHGKWYGIFCLLLGVFMALDMTVSAAAVLRWRARQDGILAFSITERLLDRTFDDSVMERVYSNMKFR